MKDGPSRRSSSRLLPAPQGLLLCWISLKSGFVSAVSTACLLSQQSVHHAGERKTHLVGLHLAVLVILPGADGSPGNT